MKNNIFSPSINILRDRGRKLNYIPTHNGEKAFNKIIAAQESGAKAFNIVGAYGTGKSAFILAFEEVLNGKQEYYQLDKQKTELTKYDTTFIVGEYNSLQKTLKNKLDLPASDNFFNAFDKKLDNLKKNKSGLLLVIDEFGKFLEYASKENTDEEIYFIQQLAEFVNAPNRPIILITTLHQAFEDYSLSLEKKQKKEWDKVKGRLVEVTFNEPVEQLLLLASKRIKQKGITPKINPAIQNQLFKGIEKSNAFPLRDYFAKDFSVNIFPFDILSASIITLAFQAYGQNERSLFSFLESNDYLGLSDFSTGEEYYHLAHVYDYLSTNFFSLLNSPNNPHAVQWRAIRESLERVESIFEDELHAAKKITKTIGLLSIFGRKGQIIDKRFLNTYGSCALQIDNTQQILDQLEKKQIIRFRNFNQRYVLFQGTDFDINTELDIAESRVSNELSVVNQLKKQFNFPIYLAKRNYYQTGTPRYFATIESDHPIREELPQEIDGYINLVFSEKASKRFIKDHSAKTENAILYGLFLNTEKIRDKLIEIEKIEIVKEKCSDDKIALNELNSQLSIVKENLNALVIQSFYSKNKEVVWFFKGEEIKISNSRDMNSTLSEICDKVYPSTPIFRNELMNREKISGTISAARKKLIQHALAYPKDGELGFVKDKYPPEKTIYLSLLKNTGLHSNGFQAPTDGSFKELWEASNKFLEACNVSKRKLSDLVDVLSKKPFKLKKGFIEFWVPFFLIIKQKEFAFYENDTFIPELTTDTLDVALRQPQKYYINTFRLEKDKLKLYNQYRNFLNQVEETSPDAQSFINTVKPFLTFYNRLSPFAKQTKQVSKKAQRLRTVLANAKDPKKTFFEDIPRALDFNFNKEDIKIDDFALQLKETTRELSFAQAELIQRLESNISKTIGLNNELFPANKLKLQSRFKKVKQEKVTPKLRVLLQRINSPLDDKQSWINSLATAVIGKSLDKFSDEDEKNYYALFKQYIHDLDNISDISKSDIDNENEDVLKLELTSFVKGVQKRLIRLPKKSNKKIEAKKSDIKSLIKDGDKQENIALLLKLLQEEIDNE
jgi:hypothetical protein